jgi:hypothetical protein
LARIREMAVQAIRIRPPAFSLLKNFWNRMEAFRFMGFEVKELALKGWDRWCKIPLNVTFAAHENEINP